MNKKEQAEFDALKADLAAARALRWPDYEEPAKLLPPQNDGHVQGWNYNAYLMRDHGNPANAVFQAWSESNRHGHGVYKKDQIASQKGVALYPTRADALRALRLRITEEYARTLASVDALIAEEGAASQD